MSIFHRIKAAYFTTPTETPEQVAARHLLEARLEYLNVVAQEEELAAAIECRAAEASVLAQRIARLNEYLGNAEDGRPGH